MQEPNVDTLKTIYAFRNIVIDQFPAPVPALMESDPLLDAMNAGLGGTSVKLSVHEKADGDGEVHLYLDAIEVV